MAIPAVILGAGKALLGGIGKKAAMGAVKSGAKNFVKDKAKNFVTGKGRKKKSNRKVGAKEVTAIVQTGGSSLTVGKGVSGTPGALVPYSSGETKEKKSRSGTATYEKLGARLKNIVSLTETLDNIVKKQYSNTKKSAKRKRTDADKAEDARREGLLEKGGKGLLGFAGNMAKKATGGFDFLNFLTSILLGGLAVAAVNLIQKFGLGKGLSVLTDNLKNILFGFRILKGALNSLGAIAWKTTKFAFGIVKKGLGVAVNGVKSLAKTVTTGIGRLTKGILTFSSKLFKGALSWAGGIVKYGKNIAKALSQGKGIKEAVKSANQLRKGKEALGIAKDVAKGTKAASDVSKAAKGASKGAKAANAIVPFSRGAKGAKGVLPGAAPFLKRIAKIRGFGGVPVIGPVLTLVAGLLDPEVKIGRAVMRTIGTAIGEMVGTFVGGAIAAGTGGIGAIAVPLLNVTGALLGEYLGDMLYIGTMGGGWQAVQKKFGDDMKSRLMDAINFGKFVGSGMLRFYEGMPKIKIPDQIINAIDFLTPGFDAKSLDGAIPDVGWWIYPFNIPEKVKLFKDSFFNQSVKPGRVEDNTQTWRDSLNDGSGPWESPDGSPIGTDEENARYVMETPGMAAVGRQTGGSQSGSSQASGNVVAPGVGNIPTSGGMKTATAIYQQLVADGVPPAAAAGVVGNIGAESNFDPAAIEGGTGIGRGLIQWSFERRDAFEKWSRDNDLDPDSMEANYGYLLYEMKKGRGIWGPRRGTPKHLQVRSYEEYIQKAKTPELAAELFMLNYERPAVATQHLGRRQNYAKDVAGATPLKAQSKPQTPAVPGAKGGSGAYASGLKTGPKGRIGSGDGYHIDTKIKASLSMEQKIAMMDQLSRGYAADGRVIEFSNAAVANMRYSHTMSAKDKAALLNKAFAAHNLPRGRALDQGGFHSLDYYIPKSGETRFGKSAEGAEILVPSIDGGKLEYHTGGNYGRFVVGVDKDGNVLFKTGHGDSKLSANRGTVSFGRSRRGTTGAAVPTTPAVPQQTTPPKAPTLPPPAIPEQTTPSAPILPAPAVPEATTAPPAPILPTPAVPEARLAPTKPQCDCSGVEKFTDYEVGGSFGAITLPIPITSTAGSGEGMVPKPQGSAGGIGGDVAGMVNSFWKKQLSSFLYKFG